MSTKSKQVAYSCNMQAVDALKEDGAVCNFYRKSYNEEATAAGGTGNRKVFKVLNDEINEYQDIYKILTGEQRAKITEDIPVIDFYSPESTGFAYHYNRGEKGNILQSEIYEVPLASDETEASKSLEYLEKEDPFILNRALLGEKSSMGQQFWGTSGQQMSDFNVITTYKASSVHYIYKGIFPKEYINYIVGDSVTGQEYRPDEIYLFRTQNLSASINITDVTNVIHSVSIQNTDESNFSIAIFIPGAGYRDDPSRFIVLSCTNDVWSLTSEYDIESYKSSVEFPLKLSAESEFPPYLNGAISLLTPYLKIDRVSLADAPGLLNGLYSEPYEFDRYIPSKVSSWSFKDERTLAQKNGVDLSLGAKYYPGHILHRGVFIPSPFRITNAAEASYKGKLSYITDKLSADIENFFDPVEVENWDTFIPRTPALSPKGEWGAQERYLKSDGTYISYADIESLLEAWDSLRTFDANGPYVNFKAPAFTENLPVTSVVYKQKGIGFFADVKSYGHGSQDDINKWNKFIYVNAYRDLNLINTTTDITLKGVNPVKAYGGSSTRPALVWAEDNSHLPRELYLFSMSDLQLEEFTADTPSRALCSFYSDIDGDKRVISFKVTKVYNCTFDDVKKIRVTYDNDDDYVTFDSSDALNALKKLGFYAYCLEPYGTDTRTITYYDRDNVEKSFTTNAAIPALSYPESYFAVNTKSVVNQVFELKDPARTDEFFKFLRASVIVPGLPVVDRYEDFANFRKTDCTPVIDCGIFSRMLAENRAIFRLNFSIIQSVIDTWPLTKGNHPLVFSQLSDFLHSLLALNGRLSEFTKAIPGLDASSFERFREGLWRDTTKEATLGEFSLPSNMGESLLSSSFPATLNNCCNRCSLSIKPSSTYIRKSLEHLSTVLDAYLDTPTTLNAEYVDECLGTGTLPILKLDATGTPEEGEEGINSEVALLYSDALEGVRTIVNWAATAYFKKLVYSETYGISNPEQFGSFIDEWAYLKDHNLNVDVLSNEMRAYFRETSSYTITPALRNSMKKTVNSIKAKGMLQEIASSPSWQYWFYLAYRDNTTDEIVTDLLKYMSAQKAINDTLGSNAIVLSVEEVLAKAQTELGNLATTEIINKRFIDYVSSQLGGTDVTTREEAIEYLASNLCTVTEDSTGTYTLTVGPKSISGLSADEYQVDWDLRTSDLLSIADFIRNKLIGETDTTTGRDVAGVEYLENGKLEGDERGLYYKRYLILNDRLNKSNGTLSKAANFINNSGTYKSVNTFNEGKIASYKEYIQAEPVADMAEMYYMPAKVSYAGEKIYGKFYNKTLLDTVKSYLGSSCVLTCTKCSVAESCPFYDVDGILDKWVPEETVIRLSLKDNKLDLLSYDDESPNLYTEKVVAGETVRETLDKNLFKDVHRPYVDILKASTSSSIKTYEGQDFHEVVEEMNHVDLQDDLSEDNSGRIISGRYGTIQVNEAYKSTNVAETLGLDEVLRHKYLYDAVFISDAEEYQVLESDSLEEKTQKELHNNKITCFNYRPSTYDYPVELDYNNKHYTGTTKVLIPSGIKLLDEANDWDDVYLASDDVLAETKPLIYLGLNCNVKNLIRFDLEDTAPTEEAAILRDDEGNVYSTANILYAKDVAQWSVNTLKGRMEHNPLGSNPNNLLENRDQYWMKTIQKPVVFEGTPRYLECPGRPRVNTGFIEMVTDGSDVSKASLISGKPFANTYVNFTREFEIVFKKVTPEGSEFLIPWSKNPDEAGVKREALPQMKTNLRLVVVKNEKPEGWDGRAEVKAPLFASRVPVTSESSWLSSIFIEALGSSVDTLSSQPKLSMDDILIQDAKNLSEQIKKIDEQRALVEEMKTEDPGTLASDIVEEVASTVGETLLTGLKLMVDDIIVDPVTDAWESVTTAVSDAWTEVTEFPTNVWNSTTEFATDVWETASGAVVDAANTVVNGVKNAANAVGEGVKDAANSVKNWFKKIF